MINKIHLYDKIITPVITEKSTKLSLKTIEKAS